MKIPIFPGKYHQNGGFSMTMLVSGSARLPKIRNTQSFGSKIGSQREHIFEVTTSPWWFAKFEESMGITLTQLIPSKWPWKWLEINGAYFSPQKNHAYSRQYASNHGGICETLSSEGMDRLTNLRAKFDCSPPPAAGEGWRKGQGGVCCGGGMLLGGSSQLVSVFRITFHL